MADLYLVGNGTTCPACGGSGLVPAPARPHLSPWRCAACDGRGRVAIPPEEIVARQVEENRTTQARRVRA